MENKPIIFRQADKNPGLVLNLPSTDVSWSMLRNVRFRTGTVSKTLGKLLITTIPNAAAIRDIFMFRDVTGVFRHLICTDTKIYSYTSTAADFDAVVDRTPTVAPAVANSRWTFDITGGYPVLSNGSQSWYWGMSAGQAFNATFTLYTQNMTTPTTTASWMNRRWTADKMRVAYTGIADIFDTDENADITTKAASDRAGHQDLLSPITGEDQVEQVKAFVPTPQEMYVMTFRGIWRISPIGSEHRFSMIRLPQEGIGLLAPKLQCTAKGVVYYMGYEDIYMLTGEGAKPFGLPIRNAIFPNLNKAAINTAFAWYNPSTFEVFFCIPTGVNTSPDTAFIYNTETKGWSICDCAYTAQALAFEANAAQWTTISNSWTTAGLAWSDLTANGIMPFSVVGDNNGNLYKFDGSVNDNEAAFTAYAETGDIGSGTMRLGVRSVIPEFKIVAGQHPVMIQVGVRDSLTQDIDWDTPQQITPGTNQRELFSRKRGFFIRLRVYSNILGANWILSGFAVKTTKGGSR